MDDQMKNDDKHTELNTEQHIDKLGNNTHRLIHVQVILAVVILAAVLSSGMAMGYSAVLLPQLKSINGSLHTDDEMGSWIASMPSITTSIGALLGGILMDCIGRKLTLHILTAVAATGWIFICVCQNHGLLLTGRFIAGITAGTGQAAGQIYIAEVTDPTRRGGFSIIPMVGYSFGILLVYILGSVLHWRVVAGLAIIPSVVSAFLYFLLPESPVWLVKHGHIEKAREASLWYRGNNILQANKEIDELISRTEHEKSKQDDGSPLTGNGICSPQVLKPLIIVNTFNILQTLSGCNLFVLYAVEIISLVGKKDINEFLTAVLTAGVRLIFIIVAVLILGFVGRRKIGIYSGLCTGLSAIILAISLHLGYGKDGYYLLLCMLVYVAAATIGFTTLPNIMVGELFPAKVRATVGSITLAIGSALMFAFAKLFPYLRNLLQIDGLFLMFGIASALASILLYATLPETKDKTLNEIEDYFRQDNILWSKRNVTDKCETVKVNNVKHANAECIALTNANI